MVHYTPLIATDDIDPETLNTVLEQLSNTINQLKAGELTQTAPDIDSLVNSTHDHRSPASGGKITVDAIDAESSVSGQVMASDGDGGFDWSNSVGTVLGFTDTPSTYSGKGGSVVRVNSSETALLFGALPRDEYLVDEGSNYTTTSNTFVDVDATNLALTVSTGGGVLVVGFTPTFNVSTGANICLDLAVNGTRLGGEQGLICTGIVFAGTAKACPLLKVLIGLAPGTYEIKLQWKTSAGTATMYAGPTANHQVHPKFFAREVA